MTAKEFMTAAVLDARTAYAAFESMRTEELLRLQIAHQLDQLHATTPEGIAFGGGRLALIAAVLTRRNPAPDINEDDDPLARGVKWGSAQADLPHRHSGECDG